MFEFDQLQREARKCRMLAGGLSNADDIRALEEMAREYEERARLLRLTMAATPGRGPAAAAA